MVAPRLTPGGLATQYSSAGQFDLAEDQALIITLPVSDAPYLGFQLGSLWYISLDYINHQTSLNGTQAQADPDGNIRIVVSDRNPGVTNWVETLGHRKGFLQFRWQRVSRALTEADGPTVELVDVDKVADSAAALRVQQDLRARLAGADRVATKANRRKNGGLAMAGLLDGKVVVISGVGPALGTTLARRCAEQGADLVLAARTVERLEDVAKQITDLGRRAVSVGTDITDEAQVNNLIEETLKAYGKVDVLINNAFRVPSMKPFANTSFEHIRETDRAHRARRATPHPGLHPGVDRVQRLCGERQFRWWSGTDPKQGAYKMAKSALLAMSQSLASELGPHGIRVNSVLPGYIWGGTLQGYFQHQAGNYGTTVDEIKAAAVNTDLKRLPTEDEVASAILFMASDLSSGITGQSLDVNCGSTRPDECAHRKTNVGVSRTSTPRPRRRATRRFRIRRRQLPRSARGVTGLDARDADLTEIGSKMHRFFVRNALVARLVSEAGVQADTPSTPRSRSSDRYSSPVYRAPEPRASTGCSPPRIRAPGTRTVARGIPPTAPATRNLVAEPGFPTDRRAVHQGARGEPGLHRAALHDRRRGRGVPQLRQSLHSVSYETLAHLPTYSRWLSRQDWTKSYQRHRKNLQLIGVNGDERAGCEEPEPTRRLRRSRPIPTRWWCSATGRPRRSWRRELRWPSTPPTDVDTFAGDVIGADSLDLVAWAAPVQCRARQA